MRRLRIALIVTLSLAVSGLASANRGRAASSARAKAKGQRRAKAGRRRVPAKNLMPKRLGEGFFSRAYRSKDGKWVIKKMRPRIAGVKKVSKKQRAEMAERTVKAIAELRAEGVPVPEAHVPEGHQAVVVQRYADGILFKDLQGKAKFEASKNLMKLFAAGRRVAKAKSGGQWYIDENRGNVFFHKDGRVKSWFDPVVPTQGKVVLSAQRALERQRKKQAKEGK
jgi:hypothetical protein